MCSPFDGDVLQEDPRKLFDFNEDTTTATITEILKPEVSKVKSDSATVLVHDDTATADQSSG